MQAFTDGFLTANAKPGCVYYHSFGFDGQPQLMLGPEVMRKLDGSKKDDKDNADHHQLAGFHVAKGQESFYALTTSGILLY